MQPGGFHRGDPAREAHLAADAPRVLLVKARVEKHHNEVTQPWLALQCLGAVARERCGWRVATFDAYLVEDEEAGLAAALAAFPADVVGISALPEECRSMHRLARAARAAAPGAVVLAGGHHPTAYTADTVADEAIDAAVLGEGEATFAEVLDRVATGAPWRDVPGLALRDPAGGEPLRSAPRPLLDDLDALPYPAWDVVDVDAYARRRGQSPIGFRRYLTIMTSRGCPYRCTYCHEVQGKEFRAHSPGYVLGMIDDARERAGVTEFDVVDDIFNFDGPRMVAICEGLEERGDVRFTCPSGLRVDRLVEAEVDALTRAGCQYVCVAIETVTPRLQKLSRKHLRLDRIQPMIAAFADRGVLTTGFFMLGFPTETEAELRATLDWAHRSRLHVGYFSVVVPFQETVLHGEVADLMEGRRVEEVIDDICHERFNLSDIPDERFYALRRRGILRFYLNPRRLWDIWRATPDRRMLVEAGVVLIVRDALHLRSEGVTRALHRVNAGLRRLGGLLGGPPAPATPRPA